MRLLRLVALSAGAVALAATWPITQSQAADGDWITIKGQVKFTKAPEKKLIANVNTDKQHCLMNGPLFYEDILVDSKSKGVKNVVVYLRPNSPNRRAPFPQEKIHPDLAKGKVKAANHTVDQPCCQFVPRVLVAREGDTIEFKNSAPVNHNVNYNSDGESFNNNMAPNSSKKTQPLKYQFGPVTFKCDIHPWMQGRAKVFDHPYFAITDAEGKFEIKNAPKGDWKIVYWHEDGFHKGIPGALGEALKGKMNGSTLELEPIELDLPSLNK